MNSKTHITRKEIADLLGVSVYTIKRKEKKWRLNECQSNASEKPILFFRIKIEKILRELGLIAE